MSPRFSYSAFQTIFTSTRGSQLPEQWKLLFKTDFKTHSLGVVFKFLQLKVTVSYNFNLVEFWNLGILKLDFSIWWNILISRILSMKIQNNVSVRFIGTWKKFTFTFSLFFFPAGLPIMSMLEKNELKTETVATFRVQIGVYLTLSSLSVLLNGTFLIVIWKSWTILKQRRITYHVTNLALSDSMVGASTFFQYISIVAAGAHTAASSVFCTITWTATLTSLLAVCLMAVERGLCIMKPLMWNQILPLKRILKIMVANWILTLPLSILMEFYPLPMKFTLLVLFNIPIFVTTVVYTSIYMKIRKATSEKVHDETEQNPSAAIEVRRNNLMQRKVGGLVLILTLVLLATVSPSFLVSSIKISCELFESNCKFIGTVTTLTQYFYMLELTNFIVNPILYVWRMSMYRQAFWKMFEKCENWKSYTPKGLLICRRDIPVSGQFSKHCK